MTSALAIDLFCGLGGWTKGLMAEDYDVIGFDIERHAYGEYEYPAQLVLQDVLTLHGAQFKDADLIVASPPCQFFSYTAMPWSRAKALAAEVRADPERLAQERALFDACFRIQAEASEAAGRHIPLVVENVRGAQPWVGRSRWNFGSFHLWGDVPALMPPTAQRNFKGSTDKRDGTGRFTVSSAEAGHKTPGFRFDGSGRYFRTNAVCQAREREGIKQSGSGREWFAGEGKISRVTGSKSPARKFASAMIAKIPLPLARHIGWAWHPWRLK